MQAAVAEAEVSLHDALVLRPPHRNPPAPELFAVRASQLPMPSLPRDAVTALRGVLPAWRAALSADELFLEEQLPTAAALLV